MDIISLSKLSFTKLQSGIGKGLSVATDFAVVTSDEAAMASSTPITYSKTSGQLYYDQTLLVKLSTVPNLSALDLSVTI